MLNRPRQKEERHLLKKSVKTTNNGEKCVVSCQGASKKNAPEASGNDAAVFLAIFIPIFAPERSYLQKFAGKGAVRSPKVQLTKFSSIVSRIVDSL